VDVSINNVMHQLEDVRSRGTQEAVQQVDEDFDEKCRRTFERGMKVSSCAGKPAEASMLVNVPKLVTAYYTQVPDPNVPGQRCLWYFRTSWVGIRNGVQ
jgi:hypothetical protein